MENPCYDGKQEISYAEKQSLHMLSGKIVIGKPETHNSCLNLPLTICSENIVEVRISGWTRINKSYQKSGFY